MAERDRQGEPEKRRSNEFEQEILMANESEIRAAAIARGRALKRANALTAVLCGGVPAAILGVWFPSTPAKWSAGFFIGLLWANAFEYVYHRFLLHVPGHFISQGHLEHHASVGAPVEAEHVNLGGSPLWVAPLFVVNSAPVIAADVLLGWGVAPGVLVGFVVYLITVEEVHWWVHMGGWLPRRRACVPSGAPRPPRLALQHIPAAIGLIVGVREGMIPWAS